jgi:uncharacterized protein (TIGR00251 family)
MASSKKSGPREALMKCTIRDDRAQAEIKAVPGASKTGFADVKEGKLRVRIAAAPEDGKANEELRRFLAKALGCPRSEVILVRGEKSRRKTVSFPAAYISRFEELTGGTE